MTKYTVGPGYVDIEFTEAEILEAHARYLMTFKLADMIPDIAATLRDYEMQTNLKLPTGVRQAMIAAADRLDEQRKLLEDVATELDSAAALKIGMMDSQSRADEVTRCIRGTLVGLSARAKELLSKPQVAPPRAKLDNSAVI